MGFFDRIATAIGGGGDGRSSAYECQFCGTTFEQARQTCPKCGAEDVELTGGGDA